MSTQYRRTGMLGGVGITNKFVCFKCRSCTHTQNSPVYSGRRYNRQEKHLCPSCHAPMWYAGPFFRAPRKTAIKKWKILERLIKEQGMVFYKGSGFIPKNNFEVNKNATR